MPPHLILDCGGHGCRALLIGDQAEIVGVAFRAVETRTDDLEVEQDADAILDAMQGAIAEVVADDDRPIAGAALGVQRGNVLCWSASDARALSPALSWRDRRTFGFSPPLMDAAAIQQRTGLRVSPYAGAAKIAWCIEHLSAVADSLAAGNLRCGPLGAWLAGRLCNTEAAVDDALAQRSLLWSRSSQDWDEALCEVFQVPRQVLPPVREGASDWGLIRAGGREIPLRFVGGDQNVLPWLDGQPDPGSLSINLGTGGFMLRPLDKVQSVPEFQLSMLDRSGGGRYAMEASVHGVATALNALLERHEIRMDDIDLDGLAAGLSAPPLFINTVDGLGSPWWKAGPKSRFIPAQGFDESTLPGQLRAVLESIAFLIKVNAEVMARYAPPPERICLSGGLAKSRLLCELIATMLDRPVHQLTNGEGTALGLWGCLTGRAAPQSQFNIVEPGSFPGLTNRFGRWQTHLPDWQRNPSKHES